ncbi:MAG: Adenine deaminase [Deltaproteobacteria bacterium ADurb.Bin510]|nr:MAG: Adenine deaminase [Deltaproteobacteria bacterium ADurb.Bin510]
MEIAGNIVDVVAGRIFPGHVRIKDGRISAVSEDHSRYSHFILPGLIDSHIHIESSMLTPAGFAAAAVVHGTVGVVADPHEIANVLGLAGVEFMLANARDLPFRFAFGAPACVPATAFESAGAVLDAPAVADLLARDDIYFLSEMMNFPGVLAGEPEVMAKLAAARRAGKPIDGHAPGLNGADLEKYIASGISTDHEAFSLAEARAKLASGMLIQIREGTGAKNFDELIALLKDYPERIMFCSDDLHPDDLIKGHINLLVRRALRLGFDPITALRPATLTPARHYNLPIGLLQVGDAADFILVDSLQAFNVLQTYVGGVKVAERGTGLIRPQSIATLGRLDLSPLSPADLELETRGRHVRAIEVIDGQLVTRARLEPAPLRDGLAVGEPERDLLKLVVLNRYAPSKPAIGFIRGFGLKTGAIAASIAHDSHNLIACGVSDEAICRALNLLIDSGGGLAGVGQQEALVLPLPIAGLMSPADAATVGRDYAALDSYAKKLGSKLGAPFMTLSFMALPVIPELKLTDQGLFDVTSFDFVPLFV